MNGRCSVSKNIVPNRSIVAEIIIFPNPSLALPLKSRPRTLSNSRGWSSPSLHLRLSRYCEPVRHEGPSDTILHHQYRLSQCKNTVSYMTRLTPSLNTRPTQA